MALSEPPVLRSLRLLADETRLRILELVAPAEQGVEELAATIGVKPPTISHHLTKLREAGLVRVRADANRRLHRLDQGVLRQTCLDILAHFGLERSISAPPDPPTLEDLVAPYLEDGQLPALPTQRLARLLVLDWVATRFDVASSYRESEVNKILAQISPEPAALRRLLLEYGFLHRVGKIYWVREERTSGSGGPA
jgi:DNA-binding transcriptional ArsR family regulator